MNLHEAALQFFSYYRRLSSEADPAIPRDGSLDRAIKSVIDKGEVSKDISSFFKTTLSSTGTVCLNLANLRSVAKDVGILWGFPRENHDYFKVSEKFTKRYSSGKRESKEMEYFVSEVLKELKSQ